MQRASHTQVRPTEILPLPNYGVKSIISSNFQGAQGGAGISYNRHMQSASHTQVRPTGTLYMSVIGDNFSSRWSRYGLLPIFSNCNLLFQVVHVMDSITYFLKNKKVALNAMVNWYGPFTLHKTLFQLTCYKLA